MALAAMAPALVTTAPTAPTALTTPAPRAPTTPAPRARTTPAPTAPTAPTAHPPTTPAPARTTPVLPPTTPAPARTTPVLQHQQHRHQHEQHRHQHEQHRHQHEQHRHQHEQHRHQRHQRHQWHHRHQQHRHHGHLGRHKHPERHGHHWWCDADRGWIHPLEPTVVQARNRNLLQGHAELAVFLTSPLPRREVGQKRWRPSWGAGVGHNMLHSPKCTPYNEVAPKTTGRGLGLEDQALALLSWGPPRFAVS